MLAACPDIHCLRDANRGGVASGPCMRIVDMLVGGQLPRIR